MYKPIKLFLYITLTISFSFANLFFSEYAEGSSNNKYLEIYNASNESVDLAQYAFPNSTNGADILGTYDYWNTFDEGTVPIGLNSLSTIKISKNSSGKSLFSLR